MATWFFEPGHTAAMFRARHMMVTYVRGYFKNVSGSLVFDPENRCGPQKFRPEDCEAQLGSLAQP